MFNIIPLILILISLSVIIFIVARKFSVLAALDVSTIQAEREALFKEQILSKRLKRNFYKHYSRISRAVKPWGEKIIEFFKWAYKKLIEFKDNYNKEEAVEKDEVKALGKLMHEAEELIKEEKYSEAEKKLIECIGIDPQNIKAFRKLGQTYRAMKNYNEANQTFSHVVKLIESDEEFLLRNEKEEHKPERIVNFELDLAGTYYDLALLSQETDNLEGAIKNINRALSVEPNNPRYLDTKIEISIILKDKISVLDALEILKKANPENNKLGDFEGKIRDL